MHIAPYDNANKPIVDAGDATVPLNYFNIVKLTRDQAFDYQVPGYETCIVPATGTVDVEVEGFTAKALGGRGVDVWDGEPEGVYVPSGAKATMVCTSDTAEVFVAGARYDEVLEPFAVRSDELDLVQYGSDDTKTHRKIKHILGQKQHDKVGRLLISELFTIERFASGDHLASYVGLIPTRHSSGDKDGVGSIIVRSNRRLRATLIEASWRAISVDPGLARYYQQQKSQGKLPANKAIIKVARKLLNRIRYVWRSGQAYQININ